MSKPDPWEKQPNESAPAFEAFRTYRDLGPERSNAKVAQAVGKSKQLMDRWSRTHSWVIRAGAWDSEQDRLYRLDLNRQRRDMAKRQAKIAQGVQGKIVARLQTINPNELSPSDLIRWLEISAKVERTALGEPDRVAVSVDGTTPDSETAVEALSDEERRARMEMLRRELNSRLGADNDSEEIPA